MRSHQSPITLTLNDLDCAIYVDGELDRDALVRLMSELSGGAVDDTTIETPFGEIDVQPNSDFDPQARTAFPDGFLYFSHKVEVYAEQDHAAESEAFVARALTRLWELGVAAVAACDYEDDLPSAGGYRKREWPWPSAKEHDGTPDDAG